jgi:hypothetical protein
VPFGFKRDRADPRTSDNQSSEPVEVLTTCKSKETIKRIEWSNTNTRDW